MQLDSYLEIFTTMYGWAFANIIGEALTATGLVIVPFVLIVFNAWKEAKISGTADNGVVALIDSVSTQLVISLFVFSVCFATTPLTSLMNVNLSYTPPATSANPNPQTASRDTGTGTTFDSALANASDGTLSTSGNLSYVPAWWFSVMSISSGMNSSIRAGLTNGSSDFRAVEEMARTATIEDPQLLQSIHKFYSQCFTPARSRFLSLWPSAEISTSGQAIIAPGNTDYGPADVDWMGSQLFRTEPGFYQDMRSSSPIAGFPVKFSRDTDYYDPASGIDPPNPGRVNPDWGRPTCAEWWLELRQNMVGSSSKWQNIMAGTGSFKFTSHDKAIDEVARLASAKANPQFVDTDKLMGANNDTMTKIGRAATGLLGTWGVGKEAFSASMAMPAVMSGLPMVQAIVLMGMYMLLPLMVFFGGYSLEAMLMGTVAIFSVKFFAVLWAFAQFVDANLINAMYPSAQGNVVFQELSQLASGDSTSSTYKRMVLNTLLMLMFFGLPMLWLGMMGWVGFNLNNGLSDMLNSHGRTTEKASRSMPPISKLTK